MDVLSVYESVLEGVYLAYMNPCMKGVLSIYESVHEGVYLAYMNPCMKGCT